MINLYGVAISPPVNKVRFTFNLLGLDYKLEEINLMAGEHQSNEYKQNHPACKVPAVKDGDLRLFESNAIIKYYCAKNNSDLYPEDLIQRASVDAWLDFVSQHIFSAGSKVVFNRLFAPNIPGYEPNESSIKEGLEFLDRFLPVIEDQLTKNKCLAGDKLTVADINLLSALDPYEVAKIDLSSYPHINKWRSELKSQDWYTKCFESYEEAFDKAFTAAKA